MAWVAGEAGCHLDWFRWIQFNILKTQRMCLQGKGVAPAHGTGICKALEYAAARERHILAPLYAVPLPRYYYRKISIQGAALHKVGPQTCAAPCCCIKWRRAYCGATGLCHPFFQGGNSIELSPLYGKCPLGMRNTNINLNMYQKPPINQSINLNTSSTTGICAGKSNRDQ